MKVSWRGRCVQKSLEAMIRLLALPLWVNTGFIRNNPSFLCTKASVIRYESIEIMKLKHIFLTLAAVALFSTAQAQVKIGANPTSIGTTSNLEVEATNGQKVFTNKTDGTLTIQNTPVSTNTADKMLGVDATGKVVTLQSTAVPVAPYLRIDGTYNMSSNYPTTPSVMTGLATTLSNQMSYNTVTGDITFNSSGIYFISTAVVGATLSDVTSNDHCLWIFKNNSTVQSACSRLRGTGSGLQAGGTATISGIFQVNAGDVISFRLTTQSNQSVLASYPATASIYKMSN